MAAIRENLRQDLRDPELSEGYAESFLGTYIATQIKVLREQRDMKQGELAQKLGTTQTVISRIEKVNYGAWNIRTLQKLARAFDVRLHVSFETYGSLIDDVESFGRQALQRVPRDKDPVLYPDTAAVDAAVVDATLNETSVTNAQGWNFRVLTGGGGTSQGQADLLARALYLTPMDTARKAGARAMTKGSTTPATVSKDTTTNDREPYILALR